jgi:threonine dehydrogenase-like Zn-dependent dehydrogenase
MKKTAFLLATLLATGVYADEANDQALALAAADIGVKTAWVETQEDVEARIAEELDQKTDALNEQANDKLDAQLEAKLAQTFER